MKKWWVVVDGSIVKVDESFITLLQFCANISAQRNVCLYKTLEKGLLSTNAETINTCPFTKRMPLHLQVCLGIWKKAINLELAYERASSKIAATHDGIDNLKQSVQPNKENAQK